MAHYPPFLCDVPPELEIVNAPVTDEELDEANRIRAHFAFPGTEPEFMVDIIRGFRLIEGAETYIEVGTRDKGNLGWLTDRLSPQAMMIDVDLEQVASAQEKLVARAKPDQTVAFVEGDSIAHSTVQEVREILDGRLADAIFLDSSHMYDHFVAETALYWPLLKPGGFLFVHDINWEGSKDFKGKAQACVQFNAVLPVWCVRRRHPVHRYLTLPDKTRANWGGLGLMIKPADG